MQLTPNLLTMGGCLAWAADEEEYDSEAFDSGEDDDAWEVGCRARGCRC